MEQIKLVAVVGPTASGKTKLAVALAKHYGGEVVSADSMQIYRQMAVATAKPSQEEMEGIPHHMMDFLSPAETFSVSDYVKQAKAVIADITERGKMPILAGGTGLYIDSLLSNTAFAEEKSDPVLRETLCRQAEADGGKALYQELCRLDPEAAEKIHPHNLVRVLRAVELYRLTGKTMTEHNRDSRKEPSPYDACILGLNYQNRGLLYDRINRRVDLMIEQGLVEEAGKVLSMGCSHTAMNAIGYKELAPYFNGESPLADCIERMKQESRRYAKRQLTWFRRNPQIHWIYLDEFERFDNIIKISRKTIENHFNLW